MEQVESVKDEEEEDNVEEDSSITLLKKAVPFVQELFHVHRKVGEGTFSSVFLATLKSSDGTKRFALKHLVPTCHPERIERELQCLQQIGGKQNVVGLDLCLRNQGSVVFVMPYISHNRFSEYVQDMTVEETKDYLRALLIALSRVHKFNVIHRDVKPSNFLYDRRYKRMSIHRMYDRYLLVDFGLAQQYTPDTKPDIKQLCASSQSLKRKRSNENKLSNSATKKSTVDKCRCFAKPKVCSVCLTRPSQTAPRAGTPGFRAPEVLLKHPAQTPAIDVWASGVMMLCILSGTQPFFRSPDDCTALAEITTVFGSAKMQQCAQKLGKKVIFSDNVPGIDIMSLCQKLQKRNKSLPRTNDISMYKKASEDVQYPKEAYHLLTKLLDLDYKTRITAEEALNHPFLRL